jgi:hypothetical protein
MNGLLETARELQVFCDHNGWLFCFIGGIAVQRWGEPRVTRAIDLSLLTGFGPEDRYIDILLAAYSGRIEGAKQFALRRRVLLLKTRNGIGIDVSLGALPFEGRIIGRSTMFDFGDRLAVRTCSAEDLIILKLFALRPLDIHDAEGVVIRHKDAIDWNYIETQLRPLAEVKGDPEILRTLIRLREL